ncbi:hypothetical protein [Kocuria rosea]|uniref:hypothetical protein n=1 Tax=Kocuria rosea TaxID=1275 RepID=UPI00203F958A|nr:hypothetical protein [Kocuria rosea]MCM3689183.1 hypothetical protein [Kocuria rosea]
MDASCETVSCAPAAGVVPWSWPVSSAAVVVSEGAGCCGSSWPSTAGSSQATVRPSV